MWIRLAEQLQGMETRDCSFIIAPGRATGQKAGINIPLPPDPDVLGRNTAERQTLPLAPCWRAGGTKDGTQLLWGLPFLGVPMSSGECRNTVPSLEPAL